MLRVNANNRPVVEKRKDRHRIQWMAERADRIPLNAENIQVEVSKGGLNDLDSHVTRYISKLA